MSDIVIVKSRLEVDVLLRRKLHKNENNLIIAASPEAVMRCQHHSISFEYIEEYKNLDEASLINDISNKLCREWWNNPAVQKVCPELNSYLGAKSGYATELAFYHVFAEALRSIFITQRLINAIRPDVLYIFEDLSVLRGGFWVGFGLNLKAEALKLIAKKHGIRLKELSVNVKYLQYAKTLKNKTFGLPRKLFKIMMKRKVDNKISNIRNKDNSKSNKNKGLRVLIHAEGRHVFSIKPIIERIRKNKELKLIILAQDLLDDVKSWLISENIMLFDPEILLDSAATKQIKYDFRSIKRRWKVIRKLPALRQIGIDVSGISLWPLVKFQFKWLFNNGIYDILRRIYLAQSTLEILAPDLVITPDESSIKPACWLIAARMQNIPCLVQLHGGVFLNPLSKPWGINYSDKIAVWGPITRQWYVQACNKPSDYFVCVGYPLFEEYEKQFEIIEMNSVKLKLGLDFNRHTLLLLLQMPVNASESYYDSPVKIYEAFFKEMEKMPDIQIIVRSHPAGRPEIISECAGKYNVECLVNPEIDLLSILKIADCVFSQGTTPFIEAMIVDKPVFFFNINASRDLAWAAEQGGIPIIRESSDIIMSIRSVLYDTSKRDEMLRTQKQFLEQYVGTIDGNASERTIRLMKEMIISQETSYERSYSLE